MFYNIILNSFQFAFISFKVYFVKSLIKFFESKNQSRPFRLLNSFIYLSHILYCASIVVCISHILNLLYVSIQFLNQYVDELLK